MEHPQSPEIRIELRVTTLYVIIALLLLLMATSGAFLLIGRGRLSGSTDTGGLIKTASAAELYPQFICTCCNQPLNKEEICCGIASDMIGYIDQQVASGLGEQDVVVVTVKKYGLKSLAQESARAEIKTLLAASAPDDRPQIVIAEPQSVDLGEVSLAAGEVSTSFTISNDGSTDLILNNLLSSCGCTSAELVIDGVAGPRFGMHNNPTDWSATLPPGEEAVLRVYYDPTVHPDFRGAATREVTLFSNDLVDFEKSVKIKLNQVD